MAHIENNWIEAFAAVAEQRSFSRAATTLHRSQSRVSAYIESLEQALGTQLFDRRHRPVELTDAGEAFLPYALQSLDALGRGIDSVSSLTGEPRGRVVLGAHPSVSAGFLPGLLKEFAATNPRVRVELSENTTVGLGDELASGQLNLAIRSMTSEPRSGLAVEALWQEPYVAVLREDDPLARSRSLITPRQLDGRDLVVIAKPHVGHDPDTATVMRRWSLSASSVAWRTEQPQTLANLVKAGLGVGIINALAMQVSDTSGLAVVQVGAAREGRSLGLWHDPVRYMSSAVRALRAAILSAPRPQGTIPV